jgi:DNA-binding MarR family transcriptional regulator
LTLPTGIDRLRASPLASEIEFLTARSRAIGSSIGNQFLAEQGLKVRSYSVLALACGGLRASQKELAEFLRLDPSQIVSMVDDLEKQGLVSREPDPGDRRSKVIVATPAGETRYRSAAVAARAAEDLALRALSKSERLQLGELLQKVAFLATPESDG